MRPALPAAVGATAPGLDDRLAACAARFARWPADRDALAEFAQLCHANGLLPEAAQAYAALAQLEPAVARWPHLHAQILAGFGRLDEALPLLQRAAELSPQEPVPWLRLGEARLKHNEPAEAAAAFARMLALHRHEAHALFGLARCDLQQGRLTAARARLQDAVAADPKFPGAPSLLATVYERLGNPAAAEAARRSVSGDGRYTEVPDPFAVDLTRYGHNPYALLVAASAEVSDGRARDALPLLARALALDPRDARIHRQLGRARGWLGDTAGARAAFEQAVALAPADEKMRTELLALLHQLQDEPALARTIADGLAATPGSAALRFEAGLLAAKAGRFDEAIGHFRFATEARPEESAAPCELAAVYFGTDRPEAGLAVLDDLLRRQPGCQRALTMLARYGLAHADARTGDWLRRALAAGEPSPALAELRAAYQRRYGNIP